MTVHFAQPEMRFEILGSVILETYLFTKNVHRMVAQCRSGLAEQNKLRKKYIFFFAQE